MLHFAPGHDLVRGGSEEVPGGVAGRGIRVVIPGQAASAEGAGAMLKSLHLHGVGPVADLSATFGERLNVLTGDNGLGKSFLLDVCFWALTGSWPGGRVALRDRNGGKVSPRITYQPVGRKGRTPRAKTAPFNYGSQAWFRRQGRRVGPGWACH